METITAPAVTKLESLTKPQLLAKCQELEELLATSAMSQPEPVSRGRVYLEGPAKFFERGTKSDGNGGREAANYFQFLIAETDTRLQGDQELRVDLPADRCYVSGNRAELVAELQQLFAENTFVVLRVRGSWKADGRVEMIRNNLRAERKAFWVTSFEVLHANGRPRVQPGAAPAARPVVRDAVDQYAANAVDYDDEVPF